MKSKDWKNLCLYLIFASNSATLCFTNIEVVKASNPSRQTKLLESSGFIYKSLDKSSLDGVKLNSTASNHLAAEDKQKTKQTKINDANTNDIKVPASVEKHIFSLIASPPIISEPLEDAISMEVQNKIIWVPADAIFLLSIKDRSASDKNIISPDKNSITSEFSELSTSTKELSPRTIKIVQNPEPPPAPTPENIEKNPPPLESQPTDFPATSPEEVEQKLNTLEDQRSIRLGKLLQLLEENQENEAKQQQCFNNELGCIRAQEVPIETPLPPDKKEPPPIEKPEEKFKPVGYLLGRVGYFHTSNIFSSRTNPVDDGLIFSGLTLAAAPFKIAPKTYLNGSIDGNIIRYGDQSEFDYNQIRFNLGIYQQLTSKMYGEIGWNNQQLFYSKNSDRFNFSSGDKFLNENSFRLSVGRRDPLGKKLNLDSFYELRLSLTNPPEDRNRVINYVWLSLNYNLQQSFRVGVDYQFSLSNFLERSREDQYHRISANLRYSISDLTSINLQSGFALGGSTDRNIDFDGWFFSVNYNWDLGQF
ncbi:hypothetical protein [Calothrix sp. CCY 0018]|uniref:hypothetical protein n=1 Tax=Calothrix sp. CCY 0018 TaxID=3103864 RepID=UPI0039C6C758